MKDAYARNNRYFAARVVVLFALAPCALWADLETQLWQGRIDACAKAGGGRVVVPAGAHVVGQLYLRNNVELHLEEGATLQGARGLHTGSIRTPEARLFSATSTSRSGTGRMTVARSLRDGRWRHQEPEGAEEVRHTPRQLLV